MEVTEHQAQTKVCRRCGAENKAAFPSGVKAPVQYGEGIRSVAAYLMGYQFLPYERCAEAMNDLFDCNISPGTLATLLKGCAGELAGAEMLIKEGLRQAAVLGVGRDEPARSQTSGLDVFRLYIASPGQGHDPRLSIRLSAVEHPWRLHFALLYDFHHVRRLIPLLRRIFDLTLSHARHALHCVVEPLS